MNKQENDDERLARKWLACQGYTDIQRPSDDPPDYVVDDKYAVEVRRLNQLVEYNGEIVGEEQPRISLRDTIEKVLAKLVPHGEGQSWIVDCEYDSSKSLPKKKVVTRHILKALQPLTQPYDTNVIIEQFRSEYLDYDKHADELDYLFDLHLCLPCGICLELGEVSTKPARFLIQNISDGKGVGVLPETIRSIRSSIEEKSRKIKHRANNYDQWWLLLVDHIFYVGGVEDLQAEIRVETPWSRIIIVNRRVPNLWYELGGAPRIQGVEHREYRQCGTGKE